MLKKLLCMRREKKIHIKTVYNENITELKRNSSISGVEKQQQKRQITCISETIYIVYLTQHD